jgi:hypothetical protein
MPARPVEAIMPARAPHLALAALAAVTLAGCADPVAPSAASPHALGGPSSARGASVVTRVRFPVTFSIPGSTGGNTCGLATSVTGTGEFQMVNRVSQTRTGEWRVGFNWTAHGTAVGADGSRYRFNYTASGTWVDVVSPTTLPVEIELVDHFNLIGHGQTPDIKLHLRGRFLFDGVDVTPVGDPVIRGGDLACDPI